MKKIFIGLILIFLDVNIARVNLAPTWLGYGLIFWGLSGCPESSGRGSGMTVALAAALLSAAQWAAAVFWKTGIAFPLGALLQLLTTYRLLVWCEELEELDGGYLESRLRLSWYALAGATAASYVLGLMAPPMGWVWALAAVAAAVFYVYTYYRLLRIAPQSLKG